MKDLSKLTKKAKIAITVFKVASLCFTVAVTVKSLMPKQEKITGIDTDILINSKNS